MILCDTNIFIHAFNQHQPTIDVLSDIGFENIVLSSITIMELYRGMRDSKEMVAMRKKLFYYDRIMLNETISAKAIELIERYKLSDNLHIPDALIGATAIISGIPFLRIM